LFSFITADDFPFLNASVLFDRSQFDINLNPDQLDMKTTESNAFIRRNPIMSKETFTIPNISCGHCVMAIKNELSEMEGVKSVEGDPESKTVDIEWEAPADLGKIKATLKEINYPAA
jgi:copper chaperone CopZ